jgi:hypothetical protein
MISRGTVASIDLHQRIGNTHIYELKWLYGYGGTVELSGLDRAFPPIGSVLGRFRFLMERFS